MAADSKKFSENKKEEILLVAADLFVTQGYEKTTLRQIAEKVGVSLGLIGYYFRSKQEIAREIVQRHFSTIRHYANIYVDAREEPMLYSSLLLNLNIKILSSPQHITFYRDMLRNDIMFEVVSTSGVETFINIRNKYCPGQTDEETYKMGWYGNHISVSLERTLILHPEDADLWREPIPAVVFDAYMKLWNFPHVAEQIQDAKIRGAELADTMIKKHPELSLLSQPCDQFDWRYGGRYR